MLRAIALLGLSACGRPQDGELCASDALHVNCTHDTLQIDDGTALRDVHFQVPLGDPPAEGFPVVLYFQGTLFPAGLAWKADWGEPFGGLAGARLTEALLDDGYAVITPETTMEGFTAWDTNLPWIENDWEGTRDDELMLGLFEAIEAGDFGPLDPNDLSAVGISSGGYMTSRMALSYPGRFRRLAIAEASWATCSGVFCNVPDEMPEDHPPTLFMHGTRDLIVPVWTMAAYRNRLDEQGTETETHVRVLHGHAWMADADELVTDWFDR